MSENKKRTIVEKMGLINRFAWNYAREKAVSSGLSNVQQKVCISIYYRPGLSQDDVAHELGMDKSSIAKLIAKLMAGGYVRRETNPGDRREYMLYLDDSGRASTEEFISCLKEFEQKFGVGAAEGSFADIDEYLDRILEAAGADE